MNFPVSKLSKLTLNYKIKDINAFTFPTLSIQRQPLICILFSSGFCLAFTCFFTFRTRRETGYQFSETNLQYKSKLSARRKGMAKIFRVKCNTMTIVNFTFIEL